VSTDTRPQPCKGVAAALAGAVVLTAVASVMPAGVRKLVLFAVVFGMGTGWIVAAAATQFATPRRAALLMMPLLTVAGLGFVAQRTWRDYQALQRAADIANPQRSTLSPMLEAIAADDPETAQMLERSQTRESPDFLQYLAVRTRPLGEWSDPWPALFWGGELSLACVAGLFVAHRMLPVRSREAAGGPEATVEKGSETA
jgi:hypothetical protein